MLKNYVRRSRKFCNLNEIFCWSEFINLPHQPDSNTAGKISVKGRRTAQSAGHDLWAQIAGRFLEGFLDQAAMPSGERTEPAVAHELAADRCFRMQWCWLPGTSSRMEDRPERFD